MVTFKLCHCIYVHCKNGYTVMQPGHLI